MDAMNFFVKKVRFPPSKDFTIYCRWRIMYVVMDVTTRMTSKVEVGEFCGNATTQKRKAKQR